MSRVRVHNFSISLDGFGTGEGQSMDTPFGHAGMRLVEWMWGTRWGQELARALDIPEMQDEAERFTIESVTTPSGVTHLSFYRP